MCRGGPSRCLTLYWRSTRKCETVKAYPLIYTEAQSSGLKTLSVPVVSELPLNEKERTVNIYLSADKHFLTRGYLGHLQKAGSVSLQALESLIGVRGLVIGHWEHALEG